MSSPNTNIRMPPLPTEPLPINIVSRGMLYIYTCTQCEFKTHIEALFKQHVDSVHLGLGRMNNSIILGGNLSALTALPASAILGQQSTLLMTTGSEEATLVQPQGLDQRVIILTTQPTQQLQASQSQVQVQEEPQLQVSQVEVKPKPTKAIPAQSTAVAKAIASGKKTFKCSSCDYSTTRRDGLAQHYDSVHLKIKSHQCQLCPYAASQKGTLNRHIKLRHKNKDGVIAQQSTSQLKEPKSEPM